MNMREASWKSVRIRARPRKRDHARGGLNVRVGWRRAHLTVDQRVARGRYARKEAPRSSHGGGHPNRTARIRSRCSRSRRKAGSPAGPDPVRADAGFPFTFFRGAALIMAADLATTPQSGVTVQLCGDAHLSNFGLFGSPERRMLFDINDFDETLPGPWEWDVKRLAASFEVMGRDRGFSPADRRDVVMAGVKEYRERMLEAAGMRSLEAWYEHLEAGSCSSWCTRRCGSSGSARRRPGRPRKWWRRRVPATARGCSPSGPTRSTGNCGSSPTPRSSSRSRT